MKLATRRTSVALAAFATAGISSVFLGTAPATAAAGDACGVEGTLVSPGVCEARFTGGTTTFTPRADMTQLEVLLVGAGGSGEANNASGTSGYAAGGGGQVRIVDLSGTTTPITVAVPTPGTVGGVNNGTAQTVANGLNGNVDDTTALATGGASGSGNPGTSVPGTPSYGGGGGAGGAAAGADGGAGVVVSTIAPAGSLFSGMTECFGGGAAVAVSGVTGVAGCGAGYSTSSGGSLVGPTANSGGGGGALTGSFSSGASGLVVIRWNGTATLAFDTAGIGAGVASQAVPAGAAPTAPATPVASGFTFGGWYSDAALTTPADFSQPLLASTTFYARWNATLAAAGLSIDPIAVSLGGGLLLAGGLGFVALGRRRTRDAD